MPDSGHLNRLHHLLLTGDALAREELCGYLLLHVVRILRGRLPTLDLASINDAVEDAVLDYLSRPSNYDPNRARIDTFITTVAIRRALNLQRRARRRQAAESSFAAEQPVLAFKETVDQGEVLTFELLRRVCDTRTEWAFLRARLSGQHHTQDLAEILGLGDLSLEGKRRAVKRMADRLGSRVRRLRDGARAVRVKR